MVQGSEIPDLFRPLLPAWVQVAQSDPAMADVAALPDDEKLAVVQAVAGRQREFAAGRSLARTLAARFGRHGPLLREPDGRPAWPAGLVGSITHCATLAAVALARTDDCAGIGIDVEHDQPLPPGVAPRLLNEPERRWIAGSDAPDAAQAMLRLFCAKEALYKAIQPLARRALSLQAFTIEASGDGDGFVARLGLDAPPFGRNTRLRGRWTAAGGYVAAAVIIDPVKGPASRLASR